MARALVLGNGTFLVCLDKYGFVRDMYYPYVGMENQVSGNRHRIGVWVDGQFSWLNDGSWQISLGYKPETMVGYLVCKNDHLNLSIVMEDIVYNETTVFLRKVNVYNHSDQQRDVRVFFHQVFLFNESKKRNTAFYDPTHNAIVHYKGKRVFIVNGRSETGSPIDDFSVGTYEFEDKEGTFRDAEDGQLGKNGVDHGSVDSVIRLCGTCAPKEKITLYYWICAGQSLEEAYALNEMVNTKTPQAMIHSTEEYWHVWLKQKNYPTEFLPPQQKKLFDTSLFVLRAHTDNRGGIIASADSAMIEYGKDDYSYIWPRDAAFICTVLDKAGFTEVTKPFFRFCQRVLHPDGYLHHRFNPDESLGSTWHSNLAQSAWLKDKILQLPIQEDESASVLSALWNHYQHSKDIEFIESLYRPLVAKIADFLISFRHQPTGLPLPSYDLWEEKIGVSTYTCASVYGGLIAAARFSELLGKRNRMRDYQDAADSLKQAAITHLYSQQRQSFIRFASIDNDQVIQDQTIDASSLFGIWYYQMLPVDDPLFQNTVKAVEAQLRNPGATGGMVRYEHDRYFATGPMPNPWFITTMWETQRALQKAEVGQADLTKAEETFAWIEKHMYPSGILAEQLHPETGESLSATPLVWSHAVYIETVLMYFKALEKLGKLPSPCDDASQVK